MMLSIPLLLAALVPSTLAWVHQVQVGGLKPDGTPNRMFWPNNFQAYPGDTVVFTFHVKNHTVTQSSYSEPCAKLTDSYGSLIGFDSGFNSVAAESDTNFPTFTVKVNDTKPIWGFCQQLNPPSTHCRSGMVFSINPPSSGKTFDAFLELAENSTGQNSLLSPTTTTPPTYSYTSNSWSTATPVTHTITLGGDPKTVGLRYFPPNITANVGDEVEIVFMQKNHTVTQASFGEPCRPLADTTWPSVQGFDTGFMFVSPNQTDYFPTFKIKVNDTEPIWAYCRQQAVNFSHCGVGMVAAINADPNSNKSFFDFQQLAVHQNGTGIVDPFGNITAPPVTSAYYPYQSYALYGSITGGSKDVANVDALSSSDDSSQDANDASRLKKLYDLAPALLGLVGAVLALLIGVLIIGIVLLRRSGKEVLPTRAVLENYRQVPVTMPSSKMREPEDGLHEDGEPRYSD